MINLYIVMGWLQAQITPVNFTSGKLQSHKSYWISNDNTPLRDHDPRREFPLDAPGDPIRSPLASNIDSKPDTYMRFGPTDRWKDVAQLTVPFFDSQNVTPNPSSWFSGIELFHKGQPSSGGFLGLKVITYNVTPHLEVKEQVTKTVNLPNVPVL